MIQSPELEECFVHLPPCCSNKNHVARSCTTVSGLATLARRRLPLWPHGYWLLACPCGHNSHSPVVEGPVAW